MGDLQRDKAVFIRRLTVTQDMAHQRRKDKLVLEDNSIPEQYQKYSNVFSEEEA